jgi:aflatoxin B1 aldehyde reductase
MADRKLKLIFGGGPIGEGKDFTEDAEIQELYRTLKDVGIETMDTARLYGNSEEWIGKTQGGDHFVIDTKTPGGFIPGTSTSAGIVQHAKESVERLGVKKVG